MLRLRVFFPGADDLRRVLEQEISNGVFLVKIEAPAGLEFRSRLAIEIASPVTAFTIDSEVVHILPGVGVAASFPEARLADARRLAATHPGGAGAPIHEIVSGAMPSVIPPSVTFQRPASPEAPAAAPPSAPLAAGAPKAPAPGPASFAEKVQQALHGTKEERAAILRDQNKQLHPFVLKGPAVTPEEVASWAANAQMSADFLKQISERKEWLSRPAIAVALARNPKTPADIAVKAVDYVPTETLRQMAKGIGALPHVVQAARKKLLPR